MGWRQRTSYADGGRPEPEPDGDPGAEKDEADQPPPPSVSEGGADSCRAPAGTLRRAPARRPQQCAAGVGWDEENADDDGEPHAIAHMLMRFSEKPLCDVASSGPSDRPASTRTMPSVTQMRPHELAAGVGEREERSQVVLEPHPSRAPS